jgi:hypothetical protein
MTKFRNIQNAFTSGEVGGRFEGRTETDQYKQGLDILENAMTLRQGGATVRGGSRFQIDIENSISVTNPVNLIPFVFSKTEAYAVALELASTDSLVVRIFSTSKAEVATFTQAIGAASGTYRGAGVSSVSDSVYGFNTAQAGNLMFIVHDEGTVHPLVLTRTATNTFTLARLEDAFFANEAQDALTSPFLDENIDAELKIAVSATTGVGTAVNLDMKNVAGNPTPYFQSPARSGHHGTYFRVDASSNSGVFRIDDDGVEDTDTSFATTDVTPAADTIDMTSHPYNVADEVQFTTTDTLPDPLVVGTNYYIIDNAANNIKVATTVANANAGTAITITDVGVGTHTLVLKRVTQAHATVKIPATVTTASDDWNEGIFGNYNGFPRTVTIFEQRLIFGGTLLYPDSLIGSAILQDASSDSSGLNYFGAVAATDPFRHVIASNEVNTIQWISSANSIEVGTLGAEYIVNGGTSPLSSSNVFIKPQTAYGGATVQARRVDQSVVFVSRDGKILREFKFAEQNGSHITVNLNITNEEVVSHLFDEDSDSFAGIEILSMAHQVSTGILWCLTSRKALIGLTIDKDSNIVAWHKHVIGGTSVSINGIAIVPNSGGTFDDLYLSVERTINSASTYSLEKIGALFEHTLLKNVSTEEDDKPYFSDSSLRIVLSDQTDTFVDGDVTVGTDIVSLGTHVYGTGTKVQLTTTGTLPAGLSLATDYFLIRESSTEVKFAANLDDALNNVDVDITAAAGGGTHTITPSEGFIIGGFDHLEGETVDVVADGFYESRGYLPDTIQFVDGDVTVGSETVTSVKHNLGVATVVRLKNTGGALPGGLATNTDYYIIVTDADTIKFATSSANAVAGTAIDITSAAGGGVHDILLVSAPIIVNNGLIAIQESVEEVIVGLNYVSTMQTLPIDGGGNVGTSIGALKRLDRVVLRFHKTYGAKFGSDATDLEEIVFRPDDLAMGDPLPLFTGDKVVDFPSSPDRPGIVIVKQDLPLPMSLLAIISRGETYEA